MGFPGGSAVKNPPANAGDASSIPGSGILEKEMATHSCILAQEIPWTEEPGRLQSMGSQRQHLHTMDEGRLTYQMVATVLLTLQSKQWNNLPVKVIYLGKVNVAMP